MAETPLLTLSDLRLGYGGKPLFEGVSLALGAGDRVALVGRNGSGKSTLLKIAAGLAEPDSGARFVQPGARIAYLPQDPDLSAFATLADYAAADLAEPERWRAEAAMDGLRLDGARTPAQASGGERRRAALARLIAAEPELMLLDEPTNHLDIAAIEWLEDWLDASRAGFLLISHDRAFLSRLSRATIWLDRGEVRRQERGFAGFEDWRDRIWEEEEASRHKLDRLIREEARWAVEGISARRTRNQGRVRRLTALRAERSEQILRPGAAAMALAAGEASGKLVIEADGIAKAFGARQILHPFSLRVNRGDRVALVGPNGAGKTTLLKLLTGRIAPDAGTVRLGTNLRIAVFDQNRDALDPARSLWETLTDDRHTGARGGADQVMVRGQPRHVVAYLKDFLFDERQARQPVGALSGGEKARLLLARIMARESNLLVLDEPTNDLDVETLDLLQDLLGEYEGTALLVSHDRDFLDRVAATTIAMEGDGRAVIYAGGWSDYRAQRALSAPEAPKPDATRPEAPKPPQRTAAPARKLSYNQERRLTELPAELDRLAAEIAKLETLLADPGLYARDPAKFQKATQALTERRTRLDAAETEWLELEEARAALG